MKKQNIPTGFEVNFLGTRWVCLPILLLAISSLNLTNFIKNPNLDDFQIDGCQFSFGLILLF